MRRARVSDADARVCRSATELSASTVDGPSLDAVLMNSRALLLAEAAQDDGSHNHDVFGPTQPGDSQGMFDGGLVRLGDGFGGGFNMQTRDDMFAGPYSFVQ